MPHNSTPIIFASLPGSLSSISFAVLGQHSELFPIPEFNLWFFPKVSDFTDCLSLPSDKERFILARSTAISLAAALHELGAIRSSDPNSRGFNSWLNHRNAMSFADVIRELVILAAPRRLLIKSVLFATDPHNTKQLAEEFPSLHVIYSTRHPVDMIASLERRMTSPKPAGMRAYLLHLWADSYEAMRYRYNADATIVSAESITQMAQPSFSNTLAKLNLNNTAENLDRMRQTECVWYLSASRRFPGQLVDDRFSRNPHLRPRRPYTKRTNLVADWVKLDPVLMQRVNDALCHLGYQV